MQERSSAKEEYTPPFDCEGIWEPVEVQTDRIDDDRVSTGSFLDTNIIKGGYRINFSVSIPTLMFCVIQWILPRFIRFCFLYEIFLFSLHRLFPKSYLSFHSHIDYCISLFDTFSSYLEGFQIIFFSINYPVLCFSFVPDFSNLKNGTRLMCSVDCTSFT